MSYGMCNRDVQKISRKVLSQISEHSESVVFSIVFIYRDMLVRFKIANIFVYDWDIVANVRQKGKNYPPNC